jgi:hypothetical protein
MGRNVLSNNIPSAFMNKQYLKPVIKMRSIHQTGIIRTSDFNDVDGGGSGFNYGGGNTDPSHTPGRSEWNEFEN